MKNHTTVFILFISAVLFPTIAWSQAILPVLENFNYSTGLLQNAGSNWAKVSGSANDLAVVEGNLTYNGYLKDAVGNQLIISSSGTEDDKLTFTAQSISGTTIYASFLLNVADTDGLGTGDYFAALGNGSTTFSARVYIKLTGSGFQLGLARNTSTIAGWNGVDLSVGTTYLVVIGYTIIPGARNDVARLWINPDQSGVEPPATLIDSNTTAKDASCIDGFFIRQGNETPDASIDALIIKLTWTQETAGIQANSDDLPFKFMLAQNYPNPFNPLTTLKFSVPAFGHVKLKVFNLLGLEVAAPIDIIAQAGCSNTVLFDGSRLASGVYYYTLEFQPAGNMASGSQHIVKKMLLLK